MTDKKILARLIPDPAGRTGCFLDPVTDIIYNLGGEFKLPGAKTATPSEDLTHTKVRIKDGPRGIITQMGDKAEGEEFYCLVQTEEGSEIEVAKKTDLKPLTEAEIAAWTKEIEDAKG